MALDRTDVKLAPFNQAYNDAQDFVNGYRQRAEDTSTTGVELAHPASSPNIIISPGGDVILIPAGALGSTPVSSGKGVQYLGGSG